MVKLKAEEWGMYSMLSFVFRSAEVKTVLESNMLSFLMRDLKFIYKLDSEINIEELKELGKTEIYFKDRRNNQFKGFIECKVK